MQAPRLSVAIPSSVVSDTPHLREKTSKIGLIGRAAAIFRVDEIIVYQDDPKTRQTADTDLIVTLLTYMETPQYLRKRLFKIKPELQYAGILPPLRTKHHPLNRKVKNLKVGEFREGCSVSRTSDGTLLDVGVEQPALLLGEQMPMNKRTTVKVADIANRVRVEWANRDEITDYWGYTVNVERRSFGNLLKSRNFDLTIATSKYGSPFAEQSDLIRTEWRRSHAVLVMFGSPTRGLHEIAKSEGTVLEKIVDFVVNTIPSQGTETVRTEEALLSTLAIFNLYFHA